MEKLANASLALTTKLPSQTQTGQQASSYSSINNAQQTQNKEEEEKVTFDNSDSDRNDVTRNDDETNNKNKWQLAIGRKS